MVAEGASAAAVDDFAAVLDPTVQMQTTPDATGRFEPPPAGEVLEGTVRALPGKPVTCAAVEVHAPAFDAVHEGGAEETLRQLLRGRVVAPGSAVHLGRTSPVVVVSVDPRDPVLTTQTAPGAPERCWRITSDTRVVAVSAAQTPPGSQPRPVPPPAADRVIAGNDRLLRALREAILWPTLHAAEAAALGVRFPRGVLLHGPPGVGKTAAVAAVAAEAGAAVHALSAGDVFGPYAGDSEAKLRAAFRAADRDARASGRPAVLVLDEIDAMCPSRADGSLHGSRVVAQLLTLMDDGAEEETDIDDDGDDDDESNEEKTSEARRRLRRRRRRRRRTTVVATTNRPNVLDPALRRPGRFDVEVEVPLPSVEQREAILRLHARKLPLAPSVDLCAVAARAKGYSGADLAGLCREAAMAAIRRAAGTTAMHAEDEPSRAAPAMEVTAEDFVAAASKVKASVVRGVAAELPPTTWADVGGLEDVKRRLQQAVEWPLLHAAAFDRLGLAPPRGILLHGPPGCAKTTVARAAATASGATVVTLAAADVFSKYVGEGERALRAAFARARRASPAILLLDEIDGMVGSRAQGSSGGDASDVGARILSVLLTEMDGLEPAGSAVLVVATTNRPNALDAALMRPGRLDLVLYVPPPDAAGRAAALRVHARGVPLADDVDLESVAARAERFTGAELQGLVREAAMAALREDMGAAQVQQRHLDAALAAANPALTEADLVKWASFGVNRALGRT